MYFRDFPDSARIIKSSAGSCVMIFREEGCKNGFAGYFYD